MEREAAETSSCSSPPGGDVICSAPPIVVNPDCSCKGYQLQEDDTLSKEEVFGLKESEAATQEKIALKKIFSKLKRYGRHGSEHKLCN